MTALYRGDVTRCRVCGRPDNWGHVVSLVLVEIEDSAERAGELIGTEDEAESRGRLEGMRVIAQHLGLSREALD
jgi:hypothetical protein